MISISPTQQARLSRLNQVKRVIESYGREGINYKELKAILMTNYGMSDRTISEYLKAIVDSGFAKEKGDIIAYEKKFKLELPL